MIKARKAAAAGQAFMMYLLTGASALLVGSSLPQLMAHFSAPLPAVAALGSAYAIGRFVSVFFIGLLTEKLGPKVVLGAGFVLLFGFFTGLTLARGIPAAMACAALGGMGMSTQDAAGPVVLTQVFPRHYPSAMSAGQAFFGAGCFLPPLVMSFVLGAGAPFQWAYYLFAGLCLLTLCTLPLMKLSRAQHIVALPGGDEAGAIGGAGTGKSARRGLLWLLFAVFCVCYCAATNTLNLYTATYAASLGIPEGMAVNVLTAFNLGSMLGSLMFAAVLRRVKPSTVLCANLALALACLGFALLARSFATMAAAYFAAGLFLGVLFSIAVTLAVGLAAGRAGKAGAIVAMLSGGADTAAPLVTGALISAAGISAKLWFAAAMVASALAASLLFKGLSGKRSGNVQTTGGR